MCLLDVGVAGIVVQLNALCTQVGIALRLPVLLDGHEGVGGIIVARLVSWYHALLGGRIIEAGEIVVVCRCGRGFVGIVERQHRAFRGAAPVGKGSVGEGAVGQDGFLGVGGVDGVGGILHILVVFHLVAPAHGVHGQAAAIHIETSTAAIAATVVGHIHTHTVVVGDGAVVQRAALEHHAAALCRGGVVVDDAACGVGVVIVELAHASVGRGSHVTCIIVGVVFRGIAVAVVAAYHQAAAHTSGVVVHHRVFHGTVAVDAHRTAIAVGDAHACRLVAVEIALLYQSAAVHIHGTATQRGSILGEHAAAHHGIVYHIGTAAIAVVLVVGVALVEGIAVADHEAVNHRLTLQSSCAVGMFGIVDISVGGKPQHMVGVARKRLVILIVVLVPHQGVFVGVGGVVAAEGGGVLECPLIVRACCGGAQRAQSLEIAIALGSIGPVICPQAAILLKFIVFGRIYIFGRERAIDADAGIEFERSVEHACAHLLHALGGCIGA